MNTSSFLAALRGHLNLPLVFRAGQEIVHPGYHLTEVKRVSYETMDCGAMTHHWSESQFEILAPALVNSEAGRGHMPVSKFMEIIDRVEGELPLNGESIARIHAGFGGQPAALYDIDGVTARNGNLWVELTGDRTRCKAAERNLGGATSGCCGIGATEADQNAAPSSCGCGSESQPRHHLFAN